MVKIARNAMFKNKVNDIVLYNIGNKMNVRNFIEDNPGVYFEQVKPKRSYNKSKSHLSSRDYNNLVNKFWKNRDKENYSLTSMMNILKLNSENQTQRSNLKIALSDMAYTGIIIQNLGGKTTYTKNMNKRAVLREGMIELLPLVLGKFHYLTEKSRTADVLPSAKQIIIETRKELGKIDTNSVMDAIKLLVSTGYIVPTSKKGYKIIGDCPKLSRLMVLAEDYEESKQSLKMPNLTVVRNESVGD